MYSVIDIGSNTIRLTVYQVHQGEIETVFHEKSTAGLAGYIDENGVMSQAGIQRACQVLLRFRRILDHLSISNIAVFATASLRNVQNTRQAVDTILQTTGFSVRVLSGEQEAMLDYIGAAHVLTDTDSGLLVDIGGGSTELVRFVQDRVACAVSLPIGSLNLYNKYVSHLLPTKEEQGRIIRRVSKELDKLDVPEWNCGVLCGVGGTVRATKKLVTSIRPGDEDVPLKTVRELLDTFRDDRRQTLLPLLKTAPDRIHTLIPGMIVLCEIAERFHCDTMTVSHYGVREGYLLSEILQIKRPNDLWQEHESGKLRRTGQ